MWNQNVVEVDPKSPQEKQAGDQNKRHAKAALRHRNELLMLHCGSLRNCHTLSPLGECAIQVRVPAVHKYVLPGDVAGSFREQEYNRVGDLLWLGHAFS